MYLKGSSLGLSHDEHDSIFKPFDFPALPRLDQRKIKVHFTIWREPSFDPSVSWTLFEFENEPAARRVSTAFTESGHTFGTHALVPAAVRDNVLYKLADLRLPVPSPFAGIGIDGMVCGFAVGGFNRSYEVRWWEKVPLGFEPLCDWMIDTVEVLEGLLPASTIELCSKHPLFE